MEQTKQEHFVPLTVVNRNVNNLLNLLSWIYLQLFCVVNVLIQVRKAGKCKVTVNSVKF